MFCSVRAGLPNSVAILALAMVPIVSLAVSALPERTDVARYRGPSVTLAAGINAVMDGAVTIDE